MSPRPIPTVAELSDRVAATYAAADPELLRAGRQWYESARAETRRLARLGPGGFGPVRAAAVIAALSPRAQWSVNLRWAERLIVSYGAADAPPLGLPNGRAKAWRVLRGADPDRELSGRKVRAFWRNLAGDPDAITVDIWAARVVGLEQRDLDRVGVYDAVVASYRAAAAGLDLPARDVQGATWLAARGVKPTDPAGFRLAEVRG